MKRKICVVVNSRANYGRIKSAMLEIKKHPKLSLQLILGASALLDRFGDIRKILAAEGFKPDAEIHTIIEGENPTTMAKSTGLSIIELATCFENLRPDIVITVADRFETLATAVAASYMNIPLAHTQGGESTGSIDESVRHAITKLAHVHFPASRRAKKTLALLGEKKETVFLVGCPSLDLIPKTPQKPDFKFFEKYSGVGKTIDPTKPYFVVLQHPVTTEFGDGPAQIKETLKAVLACNCQTIWLWPNIDAGSDQISKELRKFRELNPGAPFHFYKNFKAEDYYKIIKYSKCLIGNSSSALREGAYLGVPAVNVGSRQRNREHGPNVIHADYNWEQIRSAIQKQLAHGAYPSNKMFGDGNAGKKIAQILATIKIKIQKELNYNFEKNEH